MSAVMRPNPVRDTLLRGGMTFGTMAFEFFTPGLPAVLARAGADFVIFDMEHSGAGIETIKNQIAVSHGAGIVPMVRVPGCHYHLVAPVLDAGAMGLMVPMMETRTQAENLAKWCRYRPEGIRGLAFNMAHDEYGGGDVNQKMAEANARTLTVALVETVEGIKNVQAIAAVPGIDVVWLGHYDLTNAMGITGQFDHPDFLIAVDRLVQACIKHGKAPGFLITDTTSADAWISRGFRCLGYGTDIGLMQGALAAGIAGMRERVAKKKVAKKK